MVYLVICGYCSIWFSYHVAMLVQQALRYVGRLLCMSTCNVMSILDVTHVIKYTRFSPSLADRAWVGGYMYLPVAKSDKVDLCY